MSTPMDEREERSIRQTCLQQAQQIMVYTGAAGSTRPTGDEIRAEAQRLFEWVTTPTTVAEPTPTEPADIPA